MGKKRSAGRLSRDCVGPVLPFLSMTQLMAQENDKRQSTLQPVAPGDAFVGTTTLENPDENSVGLFGLQFDEGLKRQSLPPWRDRIARP
jgi:hypothetical protein